MATSISNDGVGRPVLVLNREHVLNRQLASLLVLQPLSVLLINGVQVNSTFDGQFDPARISTKAIREIKVS